MWLPVACLLACSECSLAARAHAFDHFRSKFPAVDAAAPEQQPAFRAGAAVRLAGRRIDVADVPRALDYERSAELELWELFRVK